MIVSSATTASDEIAVSADLFLYGLGFETRSPFLANRTDAQTIVAFKMPEMRVHRYDDNVNNAILRRHIILDNHEILRTVIPELIGRDDTPVSVAFDISSLNRTMMYEILLTILGQLRSQDSLQVYYCPARFSEPDWNFPQIERLGPISPPFSGYNADPEKPLCLMLGLGFEPGVSMGIMSQLEPSASFCFWGTGADQRFDEAVKRANFDFEYTGFDTRIVPYLLYDSKGSYEIVESITYGLSSEYNILVVPMGPKIFSFLTFLLALAYPGSVAVWRAKQRRASPRDATPGGTIVTAGVNVVQAARGVEILTSELKRPTPPAGD